MKRTFVALAVLQGLALPAAAATQQQPQADEVERIVVTGVRQRLEQNGTLADAIMKTEVIGMMQIENHNAVNLTEAIDTSPGVRVSNECSMCGVKRIMLNGMKGEQTTILVDGLPVHTMISGFYAVDAIPTTGIESIEVARGAGASLIAPEAIGGTVNVISLEPYENTLELDLAIDGEGCQKMGLMGGAISDDGMTRATVVAQYDDRDQVDNSGNGVNESPHQSNRSFIGRVSHDIGNSDNLVLRVANLHSEVFGGPMLGEVFADGKAHSVGSVLSSFDGIDTDPQDLFVDGDVRNQYIGKAWEMTEWIETERNEVSLSWLHEFSADLNTTTSAVYADHTQDSFYEGFDYTAKDTMWYAESKTNYRFHPDHLLTFGADYRNEEMRSSSHAGAENPAYISDSFDYEVIGLFIQDNWQPTDDLEIALALRYDTLTVDFTDPMKPGVELEESILSPRADIRYHHSSRVTSRLSAGRGYRAPLSFFETDHGILDGSLGFEIDINDLERSNSVSYSLNYTGDRFTATASAAWTEVENLAVLDETDEGVPLLTQLDEKARVITTDIALGYSVSEDLQLNLTAEYYDYDDNFASSYAIAPIEERVMMSADWRIQQWELFAAASWIGSRDLTRYGYEGYNRVLADGSVDLSSEKTTQAPSYVSIDLRAAYALNDVFSVYAGVSNLLDYTQAGDEDTPLFFDDEGALDVGYIYGPLVGREIYAGIKLKF
ncbi:TonB-dependent receptor plug domain-containing protein [Ferrimonas pelagia]|uniref:TonB-dependent receptor n=1 Tax=Ferrimonas pelagia TaxID=1177826 RepID=A0ABP9F623_9GAMM